jgi:L-iditol 2-dehydrogenase
VRAVVLGATGEPELADIPEPAGEGALADVLACGLCGSDVEKIGGASPGTVLGHEVVVRTADGRRAALVHHLPCGECERCRAGHESTCERFPEPTIVPGGFAERALATGGWVELPDDVDDVRGSYAEPLACVLRGAERVPRGGVVVVGQGFMGRLFRAVLERRGDDVFAVDRDPARDGRRPGEPVENAVLCAPGASLDHVGPGGTVLVFVPAGTVDLDDIYRRELTLVGSRSATPRHLEQAVALLATLELPKPTVLPLERFAEGLELYRRREALKVVFTP